MRPTRSRPAAAAPSRRLRARRAAVRVAWIRTARRGRSGKEVRGSEARSSGAEPVDAVARLYKALRAEQRDSAVHCGRDGIGDASEPTLVEPVPDALDRGAEVEVDRVPFECARRFDSPVVSNVATRSCTRRFASSQRCGNRSECTNSFSATRITLSIPVVIAGPRMSARSGSTCRASASKSTFDVIAA